MRFKVGDKVIVKSFSERPVTWNILGGMDKWMGKIVTVRKYREGAINPYLIEEDKGEGLGVGWCWRESDFLPIPKPGDRVKLRTWEDMEKQYGLDGIGDIKNVPLVVRDMKKYCGTIVNVSRAGSNIFTITEDASWHWRFNTIEEVYPKEEKMEFTKDMLKSGEHVVKLRDGYRLLYLNERLVGCESGTDIQFYSSDLRNTGCESDKLDIMAVYKATAGNTLDIILKHSNELIWERDEEPIEISATEAFAQFREIYGKEVKIVEDKDD